LTDRQDGIYKTPTPADKLLLSIINITQKTPKPFITDGLPCYASASKKVFGKDIHHPKNIHPRGQMNNKMERLNGEIMDREKVFRGLKKDSPIIVGVKICHSYIIPYS